MTRVTDGEKELQIKQNTENRAKRFYEKQMKTSLNKRMRAFIENQEMVFIATSDAKGNCDCSPRFGNKGFIKILDEKTLVYPEYRGNGVFASLGNILENSHIGMVFVDFFETAVGLHVNGTAFSYANVEIPKKYLDVMQPLLENTKITIERWVFIHVDEAYIHCSKHVPKLKKTNKPIAWGTDDNKAKQTEHFMMA
jgi:predicted pyridoxine 5'-phosphate oxidase superfamily flavin-nucleotide-binding protein